MKKKITALLLCMAMFVTMLPMMAFAQDPVYYSEITGSWSKTPEMNEPLMNCYVNISTSGIHKSGDRWLIKDESAPGGWGNYGGSYRFYQGTYVHEVQLSCRADSPDDYKFLSEDATLTVDGVKWTRLADTANDYSCWFRSSEYTVKSEEKEISHVDLKWKGELKPEIGKKAELFQIDTTTEGIEEITSIAWVGVEDCFEKGTYQTPAIRLVPEEGYVLADDLTISFEETEGVITRVIDLKDDPTLLNFEKLRWFAVEITLGDEEPKSQEYTVSFDANGGTDSMAPMTTTDGGKFTVPACTITPPEGKEFDWWSMAGTEVQVGANITLSSDLELKAIWKQKTTPTPPADEPEKGTIEITKAFVGLESGEVPNDIAFSVSEKDGEVIDSFTTGVGFPPVRGSSTPVYRKVLDVDPGDYTIEETNYKISGYKEKVMIKIGSGEPRECDSVDVTVGEGEAVSIIITDEYVEIKHDVTFVMNGHGTAPAAQSVKDGECAVKPADPKADGYTFGGWYKDQGCTEKFEFTTQIKENTVVYAKWTKDEPKKDDKDKKDDKNNSGKTDKNKNGNKKNGGSVPTGDSTQEMPFVMLLIAGLFCFAAAAARRLRRN